jgi:uncharacterized membrane protein YGL010W
MTTPLIKTKGAQLLAEYAADHQHPFNRLMHSICVPVIFVALIGLLAAIPLPGPLAGSPQWLNLGTLALAGVILYYLRLAPRLGVGMLVAGAVAILVIAWAARLPVPLWLTALVAFSIGWAGQFIGHYVEGRRPSFFRDLRFLLIGPLWVLAKLYAALGIRT